MAHKFDAKKAKILDSLDRLRQRLFHDTGRRKYIIIRWSLERDLQLKMPLGDFIEKPSSNC